MVAAASRALALVAAAQLSPAPAALRVPEASGAAEPLPQEQNASKVPLQLALHCLGLTTRNLRLRYPDDAEEHVEEIRQAMRPWFVNFTNTYNIEDIWMNDVAEAWDKHKLYAGARLSDLFGPYVPIFVHWVYPWFHNPVSHFRYPAGMLEALRGVLRENVPYVTASQNDEGLAGQANEFSMSEYPNLMVLSGGGYGHVAVPLIKSQGRTYAHAKASASESARIAVAKGRHESRQHLVAYTGTMIHAPHDLRQRMAQAVQDFVRYHGTGDSVSLEWGGDWRGRMLQAKFNLVPRGWGRTSYHMAETIQMGLIPIQVYSDIPWLPYPARYREFGYATTVEQLGTLLEKLKRMSDEERSRREELAMTYGRTHWTPGGILVQLMEFFQGRGDLRCQALPRSIRDA